MKKNVYNGHKIKEVLSGSIASELGIVPGDVLLYINDKEVKDVFDYDFMIKDEALNIVVRKEDGEEWEFEIEKDFNDELGIVFEDAGLMDNYRSCSNKCIFCFIDQMPPGMRKTLYFKDDDARLSFLQGNYITLTNLSKEDMDRIVLYKLSPINVSVHTTNKELRCKMLNNRFAGDALAKMDVFRDAGIEMNGQIVLCKGYNDRAELDKTIEDLSLYFPSMKSVSVVPIGMTKYRQNLTYVEPFTKEDAEYLIMQIEGWQMRLHAKLGSNFVFASDEWYIKAEKPIPSKDKYDGFPQIENGVGMVRSLEDEVDEYLKGLSGDDRKINVSAATGVLAYPIIEEQIRKIKSKFPNINCNLYKIINNFFGEQITVAGLITGTDLCEQLSGKELGEYLILPKVMLKSDEDIFLDDMKLIELEKSLQTKTRIVKSDGKSLVDAIIGNKSEEA